MRDNLELTRTLYAAFGVRMDAKSKILTDDFRVKYPALFNSVRDEWVRLYRVYNYLTYRLLRK